ncbi:cilia- and flagella-associated protein 119 isoform X3 [Eleutherodactylus coqui]|uniref:cilia- and flagella-associated protein 119 isoform X3 n=1 Tax=Eleutherodactylus coqui TaxID=57060 RepID=UPI003461B6B3
MSAERESWSPSPVNRGDVKGCGIKIRKPQVCLWKDVTLCDLEKLERAQSNEDVRRALSEVLGVRSGPCDVRASALLDLHYYTLRFCWDCGFSAEQTSCVFSIVKEIHAACVGSTLGDVTECYRHCQQLLLCHAVSRPPFSINLFSPQELLHIRDYILNTYFRHFKLYKCVFSSQPKSRLMSILERRHLGVTEARSMQRLTAHELQQRRRGVQGRGRDAAKGI